ncbi:hypothetical protein MUY27_00320 [Mucilaginibacter sp. RS28]|uniref:Uncharacterized protein n=1 Tax=Mucilaginibacter straminoryzae TaxID=2932774 RepID=A0A9X1X440_9SPHI|nr:hypothetical protein [Mucilaginibacter straminoryzae]MCJ8208129.1 hypothetical protein [Mucilaginibacter straminoryzae]
MGTYMTVVLKKQYQNEAFIAALNDDLIAIYGAETGVAFNTWAYLQEEADFMNTDPEGLRQLPDWKRPISKEQLSKNFFWLRFGEFAFKLSGGGSTAAEAQQAVAVSKWIAHTNARYIDKNKSEKFTTAIVASYFNAVFKEAGYDLKILWQLPQ